MDQKFISLFSLIALAIPATHAEVYKCQGPNGQLLFQQQPCRDNSSRLIPEGSVVPLNQQPKTLSSDDISKIIREDAERSAKQTEIRTDKKNESKFFIEPEKICHALDSEGLQTQGWKPSNASLGEFLCLTNLVGFGHRGINSLENNIAFYVNGKQKNRADDIRIKININNPETRQAAFIKLQKATEALFQALGEPIPGELHQALVNQKAVSISTSFGKAELLYEPGRIDSYKVVLTNKIFLENKKANIVTSVADFEKCKAMIAQAAKYEVSDLQGDGEPIQEQGFKSFMLTGRNKKDIFFCEVHQSDKYRVRASIGGGIPFKVINEGKF